MEEKCKLTYYGWNYSFIFLHCLHCAPFDIGSILSYMQNQAKDNKSNFIQHLIYTLLETLFGKYVTLQRLFQDLGKTGSIGYSEIEVHTGIYL